MKRFTLSLLALCAVLMLAACSVEVDPDGPDNPDNPGGGNTPPQVEGNNAAILTGETLGDSTAASADLRKEISVELNREVADLQVGDAYLARESADTETFEWLLALTNTGEQTYCFVEATDLQFRDSVGVLLEDDNIFVQGSVRVGANDVYTDTCLSAGQTGYFLGIETAAGGEQLYSVIDSLTIGDIEVQVDFDEPDASVEPQRYAVSSGATQQLAVDITNTGTSSAEVEPQSNYVLLDEDGSPLTWNFFNSPANSVGWDGTLAANDTQVLNDTLIYRGSAERLLAYVDYTGLDSALEAPDLSALAVLDEVTAKVQFVALRNAHEARTRALWLEATETR